MEPNTARAEAERWLGISAKLLAARDLVGSRSFAIRARESDPTNPISDQILAVVDTLIAAEKRVINSTQYDWYSILQLSHLVRDPDLIVSQYRRLVLLLNPDHNHLPFADFAFRVVFDAWSVLGDPTKKWIYDSELSNFLQRSSVPPDPEPVRVDSSAAATYQFFQQPPPPPPPAQSQAQAQQQQWIHHLQEQQQQQQQQQPQLQERQLFHQQHHSQPPPPPPVQQQQQHQWLPQTQNQPQQQLQQLLPEQQQQRPSQPLWMPQPQQPPPQPPQPPPQPQQPPPQQWFPEQQRPPPQPKEPQIPPQLQRQQPQPQQQKQPPPPPHQPQQSHQQQKQPPPPQQSQQQQKQPQQSQQKQQKQPQQAQQQQQKQPQQSQQEQQAQQSQQQQQKQAQQSQQQQKQAQQSQQQQKQPQQQMARTPTPPAPVQTAPTPSAPAQTAPTPRPLQQLQREKSDGRQGEGIGGESNVTSERVTENGNNSANNNDSHDYDGGGGKIEGFWTACPYCYYLYEYAKTFEDCTLRCQNCRRAFHALQIPNPPGTEGRGGEASFCSWGAFPMGFSMTSWKKSMPSGGGAIGSNWVPFSPMFACPVQGVKKKKKAWRIVDEDDEDLNVSDDDEDSSDDWGNTNKRKRQGNGKVGRGRPRKSNTEREKMGNQHSVGAAGGPGGDSLNHGVTGMKNDVITKVAAGGSLKKQMGKGVRGRKKLDLNVEFSNEVEDHATATREGTGEEVVEFFEGLDEFLSTLPILKS